MTFVISTCSRFGYHISTRKDSAVLCKGKQRVERSVAIRELIHWSPIIIVAAGFGGIADVMVSNALERKAYIA